MTDFLLPPDLPLGRATIYLDANTSAFSSPTVGSTRSIERLGDRLRFNFDFTVKNDLASTAMQRGRMQAFLARLRGQAGRVVMPVPGYGLARGSFPDGELLLNNTFSGGTASWTPAAATLTVSNRTGLIASNGTFASVPKISQTVAGLIQYVPYVGRAFVVPGPGAQGAAGVALTTASGVNDYSTLMGLRTAMEVSNVTTGTVQVVGNSVASGFVLGAGVFVPYTSLQRCALVDNGLNLLLFSDQIDNAAWTKSASSITPNAFAAPDGTTTADGLVDTAVNTNHYVSQSATVPAAVADFTVSAVIEFSAKSWAFLQMATATGTVTGFFNLAGGVVGSISTGSGWTNGRLTIVNKGGNRNRVTMTVRKISADTSIQAAFGAATADLTSTYTGAATTACTLWRLALSQSSMAYDPDQTVGTAITSSPQNGRTVSIKGLPVSTAGLLLAGDWIECNGQLNQVTDSLDSDAVGLGTLQLTRPFRNAPADNAPVIITNPMGKFMVNASSTSWNEQPGSFSDATVEFIEDISF